MARIEPAVIGSAKGFLGGMAAQLATAGCILILLTHVFRVYRTRRTVFADTPGAASRYAVFLLLGRGPQLAGAALCLWRRFRGEVGVLIEYKRPQLERKGQT